MDRADGVDRVVLSRRPRTQSRTEGRVHFLRFDGDLVCRAKRSKAELGRKGEGAAERKIVVIGGWSGGEHKERYNGGTVGEGKGDEEGGGWKGAYEIYEKGGAKGKGRRDEGKAGAEREGVGSGKTEEGKGREGAERM